VQPPVEESPDRRLTVPPAAPDGAFADLLEGRLLEPDGDRGRLGCPVCRGRGIAGHSREPRSATRQAGVRAGKRAHPLLTGSSYKSIAAVPVIVTRAAVREGFERYVNRAVDRTAEAFRVPRALREGGPGSATVKRLLGDSELLRERVVQPELETYRTTVLTQFETLLDAVESDDGIEAHREALLAADAYDDALSPSLPAERRGAIRDELVERQRRFGEAITPLVSADQNAFWPAVTATLSRAEAVALVEEHFVFTGPLRAHTEAFRMAVTFDPGEVLGGFAGLGAALGGLPTVEVDYTDEALRAMTRAEAAVIDETKRDLDARYD
jgi:hypothetical protein